MVIIFLNTDADAYIYKVTLKAMNYILYILIMNWLFFSVFFFPQFLRDYYLDTLTDDAEHNYYFWSINKNPSVPNFIITES